jgi:hypothetical protein
MRPRAATLRSTCCRARRRTRPASICCAISSRFTEHLIRIDQFCIHSLSLAFVSRRCGRRCSRTTATSPRVSDLVPIASHRHFSFARSIHQRLRNRAAHVQLLANIASCTTLDASTSQSLHFIFQVRPDHVLLYFVPFFDESFQSLLTSALNEPTQRNTERKEPGRLLCSNFDYCVWLGFMLGILMTAKPVMPPYVLPICIFRSIHCSVTFLISLEIASDQIRSVELFPDVYSTLSLERFH